MNDEKLNNHQLKDNTSKLIFGDAILCAQFMRDFLDIPLLKNVRPEDIEDVSQRYVPLFTSEREADTVKRVWLSDTESLFFITYNEMNVDKKDALTKVKEKYHLTAEEADEYLKLYWK